MAKRQKIDSMKVAMEVDAGRLWERIQAARQARGMSQNELARVADMTVQNLQKIEQGYTKSIPYETLDAICKALGISTKRMMQEPKVEETEVAA